MRRRAMHASLRYNISTVGVEYSALAGYLHWSIPKARLRRYRNRLLCLQCGFYAHLRRRAGQELPAVRPDAARSPHWPSLALPTRF